MKTTFRCPNCGVEQPSNALEGLCPACVINVSLVGLLGRDGRGPAVENSQGTNELPPPKLRFFGDYELLEELAAGGMGIVYRARQISLNRVVALKMIRAGLFASDAEVKRFRVETEAAASLDHPNIVPIYEVGERSGHYYFVMKLIEGGSLAEKISRSSRREEGGSKLQTSNFKPQNVAEPPNVGGYDLKKSARLLATVARAVHYAHQRGVLHRDLKPANILLDDTEKPYVSDFGVAKLLAADSSLTLSGAILGTPNYMSPEAAGGGAKQLTTAADIYSLGAILYELLTGKPPFRADTPLATMRQVMDTEPERPTSVNRKADRDLETICLKCLEKEPARRYTSARALAEDLERWLRHEPIQARSTGPSEKLAKWITRHPMRAGALFVFLLVLFAGVLGIFWQWRRAEAASANHREALAASLLAQAHAQRIGGEAGRRFQALAAIREAARIRPTRELRDEAIACLTLTDLGPEEIIANDSVMDGSPLSPDFKSLLLGSSETGLVRVVSTRDKHEICRFSTPGTGVWQGYWSGKGRYIAIRQPEAFRIWEASTGKTILQTHIRRNQDHRTLLPEFSPDERLVALENNDDIIIYELPSGIERKRLPSDPWPRECHFHPSKPWVALMHGTEVTIWDFEVGETIKTFTSNTNDYELSDCAWSPDGRLLAAAGYIGPIYTWVGGKTKPEFISSRHLTSADYVGFNNAGDTIVSWGWSGDTRLLSAFTSSDLVRSFRGKPLRFSPDDRRLAFTRAGGILGVWPVATGGRIFRTLSLPVNYAPVDDDIAFSPDGHWLASVVNHSEGIRLWDLSANRVVAQHHAPELEGVYFEGGGQTLLTVSTKGVARWPLSFDTNAAPITCRIGKPQSIPLPTGSQPRDHSSLSRDGRKLLLEDQAEQVLLIDLADPVRTIAFPAKEAAKTVALSPDGRRAAIGHVDRNGVRIYDTGTGQRIKEFPASGPTQVGYSPDGRWLVLSTLTDFQFLEAATLKVKKVFPREMSRPQPGHITFSPEGRYFACLKAQRRIELIDCTTLESLATLTMPDGFQPWKFRFSPDGRLLGVFGDSTIYLWDLPELRRELASMALDW